MDMYQEKVNLINFYKSSDNVKESYLKAIEIDKKYLLLPISRFHIEDELLISKLTDWRNDKFSKKNEYLDISCEDTKNWLSKDILNSEGVISFLILNSYSKVLGHISLLNFDSEKSLIELSNIYLEEYSLYKEIFSNALKSLIKWCYEILFLDSIKIKINKKDLQTLQIFKDIGFETIYAQQSEKELKEFFLKKPKFSGNKMILTAGPSISAKEAVYSYDAALNGWNNNWSKYLSLFEKSFAKYIGSKHAIATSSCTGALQISLMALDIKPGDEVIVPDQTWVATANAVRYVGATPIFADIELDNWNLNTESIEKLITNKTKAIIVVHMYGGPARMNKIIDLAKKYNLRLVEDAAPAIGAEWNGKRCGTFGDFGAFSFQGAKLLVTGEGGMLVTDNDDLYEKAKRIWDQGRNPSKVFWIDKEGVKFKMSNIQAALGLGQLERIRSLIAQKRRIFKWYEEGLSGIDSLNLNKEINGGKSIYWMTSIVLNKSSIICRDELMTKLKEKNIDTRPVFPSISQYPIWGYHSISQPNSLFVSRNAMNLPSGVCRTRAEIEYVCTSIKNLLKH